MIFGSCVARDTIEFAEPDSVEVLGYVARQSVISAFSNAGAHLPEDLGLASKFQARMIRADFFGSLPERLAEVASKTDVLLWDLTDERHGVHLFPDGQVVTRSIDTMRSSSVGAVLAGAAHLGFGTDEHFELWRRNVELLRSELRALHLLERTIVLYVPWAVRTTDGKTTPWSMGLAASDANALYDRYYTHLRRAGFTLLPISARRTLADPEHRWGLAPFHYARGVYEEVLTRLQTQHALPIRIRQSGTAG